MCGGGGCYEISGRVEVKINNSLERLGERKEGGEGGDVRSRDSWFFFFFWVERDPTIFVALGKRSE